MLIDLNRFLYKNKIEQIRDEALKIKDIIKFERYREKGVIFKWLNDAPGGVWSMVIYHEIGVESLKEAWHKRNNEMEENIKKGIPMPQNQVEVQLVNSITEEFPEFDNIVKILKTIPYCPQCFINFIEPKSLIIKHVDKHLVGANGVRFYPCIISVSIPSSDPAQCVLNVGGVPRPTNDGDIMIIDGSKEHYGWNHTDDWRITMIVDLDQRLFI